MVTPYFCFTAAAGKLSKVHMPSSASAGTLAHASRVAKRSFKRMVRFSIGSRGRFVAFARMAAHIAAGEEAICEIGPCQVDRYFSAPTPFLPDSPRHR